MSRFRFQRPSGVLALVGLVAVLVAMSTGLASGNGNGRAATVNRPGQRLTTPPSCVRAPSPAAYFADSDVLRGGDYQRAVQIDTNRTLWTLQDAYVYNGERDVLVHNVAVIQDGTCYTLLHGQYRSWLFAEQTSQRDHWFWVLDGYRNAAGINLYVAEMTSTGNYLQGRVSPVATWVVTVDPTTFQPVSTRPAGNATDDLFGWSVTTDKNWVYQYSWCYRQFGWGELSGDPFGFDTRCTNKTFLARIPRNGDAAATPTYWTGRGWTSNRSAAVSIFGPGYTGRGIANPIDVVNDNGTYRLITKPDDWWGTTVYTFHAPSPAGPWTIDGEKYMSLLCSDCNTYYASWIPGPGSPAWTWAISNNHWTVPNTDYFYVTFYNRTDLNPR